MQKWHIYSAIGRGRPIIQSRSTIASSHRYIHNTFGRAQEVLKERTVEEPSKPLFSRAKRLQEATYSIENLYQDSAARDKSSPGHRNAIFGSVPSRGSQSGQPAVFASRHLGGVPLSKDVIDGPRGARSSDGERFTMDRGRGQPLPRAGVPAGREAAQPVVDARSLGVRPEIAQGTYFMRDVRKVAPPDETRGPSERSILRSRNPKGSYSAERHYPHHDMNGLQQGSPRENKFQQPPLKESVRSTGTQPSENVGRSLQTGSQTRTQRGEGRAVQPGRSRDSRSRPSQYSDQPEPRRRKRGSRGDSDRRDGSGPEKEKWTEEEQQYLNEKAKRKSPKAVEYEPVEFGRETFIGMGPATASDEWGMSEMLGERLLLARKYLDREFIQWDSREQKADVMAVVEKLKAVRGHKATVGDEKKANEATLVSGDGDQQAQALMQKLFGGSYDKFKRLGEKDVLGHVERYVHRNDSYFPDDEKSLLEKVRSILPAEQASNAGRGGMKEVKA
ncbi:MAG: hypothetical protein ASARMPREDX12_003565 [Alectoria sarmentosa]|nr:MAG: hypothetical protein ASARMPREDX12_003565 [Alectoria sarmentosa]